MMTLIGGVLGGSWTITLFTKWMKSDSVLHIYFKLLLKNTCRHFRCSGIEKLESLTAQLLGSIWLKKNLYFVKQLRMTTHTDNSQWLPFEVFLLWDALVYRRPDSGPPYFRYVKFYLNQHIIYTDLLKMIWEKITSSHTSAPLPSPESSQMHQSTSKRSLHFNLLPFSERNRNPKTIPWTLSASEMDDLLIH